MRNFDNSCIGYLAIRGTSSSGVKVPGFRSYYGHGLEQYEAIVR